MELAHICSSRVRAGAKRQLFGVFGAGPTRPLGLLSFYSSATGCHMRARERRAIIEPVTDEPDRVRPALRAQRQVHLSFCASRLEQRLAQRVEQRGLLIEEMPR